MKPWKFEKKLPRLSFVWREGGRKEEKKSLTNKQTKEILKSKENSLTNKQRKFEKKLPKIEKRKQKEFRKKGWFAKKRIGNKWTGLFAQ